LVTLVVVAGDAAVALELLATGVLVLGLLAAGMVGADSAGLPAISDAGAAWPALALPGAAGASFAQARKEHSQNICTASTVFVESIRVIVHPRVTPTRPRLSRRRTGRRGCDA
jgi:hypothetical protein